MIQIAIKAKFTFRKIRPFFALALASIIICPIWSGAQDHKHDADALHLAADKIGISVSEEEVKNIAHQLMAPCCWSQTADVHTSDPAKEMRGQIRAALQKGYDEKQIVAAFVAKYGERILATPRASGFNLMVWVLPGAALVLGGFAYWRYIQRTCALPPPKMKSLPRTDETYGQRFERELAQYDF